MNGKLHRRWLLIASLAPLLLMLATPAPAWYPEGHEVIAIIAADNLTPQATTEIAHILGVADKQRAVADAMAAASILPDTEFRFLKI